MFDPATVLLQVTSTTSNSTVTSGAPAGKPLLLVVAELAVVLAAIVVGGAIFTRLTRRIAMRAGASKSVARTADQWVAVLMGVLAIAAVASITGISSEFTTLTISGIAGLAVSLALQTTLSNIISGILMLQDGVIRLGDEIEFGSVRGVVVKLSLRTTWLKRQDGTIVVVGNTNLSAGPIVNYTAKTRLQRKLQV